jgi:hypothetical protein
MTRRRPRALELQVTVVSGERARAEGSALMVLR